MITYRVVRFCEDCETGQLFIHDETISTQNSLDSERVRERWLKQHPEWNVQNVQVIQFVHE